MGSPFFVTDMRTDGVLYVVKMCIEDMDIYKIGYTTRTAEERMMEILEGFFKKYRYVPRSRLVRFRKVPDVQMRESELHKALEKYRYVPEKTFGGSTEMFTGLDDLLVVEMYERCLAGGVGVLECAGGIDVCDFGK